MTAKVSESKQHRQGRSARRRDRYSARATLWHNSTLKRVKACGLHPSGQRDDSGAYVKPDDPMAVLMVTRSADGNASGWGGVQSCGSTWACPVCSERIQTGRQAEVTAALEAATARGWVLGFHTFTVRHQRAQSLADVWGAVSGAWRATVSGSKREWEADTAEYGIEGYLRLVEVTHGANGWHVHIHVITFLNPLWSDRARLRVYADEAGHGTDPGHRGHLRLLLADVEALGARMFGRWKAHLRRTEWVHPTSGKVSHPFVPVERHGHDHRMVTSGDRLAAYFSKGMYAAKSTASAGFDLTGSHAKQASRGNVTPFGILARIVAAESGEVDLGDPLTAKAHQRDRALWADWERVSKGKRQLLWSNGLRSRLVVEPEQTDEELANDTAGGTPLVAVRFGSYRRLARGGALPQLLDAAELPEWEAIDRIEALLRAYRVPPEAFRWVIERRESPAA